MKRTKKLLALVLALVMSFSLMAVTAAAYDAEGHDHNCTVCSEDDGIMPQYEVKPGPPCIICGGSTAWGPIGKDHAGQITYGYVCVNGCRV